MHVYGIQPKKSSELAERHAQLSHKAIVAKKGIAQMEVCKRALNSKTEMIKSILVTLIMHFNVAP